MIQTFPLRPAVSIRLLTQLLKTTGGAGSGNFGHAGRPGQQGGSTARDVSGSDIDSINSATKGPAATTSHFVAPTAKDAARLKALKIPPAWTDVRINPDEDAALQAIGRDKKGRTQYRYSAEHSVEASAEKFERLKAFDGALPALRDQIKKDVQAGVEPAAILQLIDKTGFRIGSDQDTKADKKAFGASTMLSKHVKVNGDKVNFKFVGKKGVDIRKTVVDSDLAKSLGPRVAKGGRLFEVNDMAVRAYLHSHATGFTPKDFRTWYATNMALGLISKHPKPTDAKSFKKAQKAVAKAVSDELGNTPSVTIASYIDPAAWSPWKVKP